MAVLMVMYGHYVLARLSVDAWGLPEFLERAIGYSRTGVDLFFVLSGFLIGGILLDNRHSRHYFSTFYIRRFWRIAPLYAVLLLAAVAGVWLLGFLGANTLRAIFEPTAPWYSYPLFLQNFFVPFVSGVGGPLLGVTWSLAVEEHFYVTLPLLVWLLRKNDKALALAIGFFVLLAPFVRVLLASLLPGLPGMLAAVVYMPARLDVLGLGVLGAMAVRSETVRRALSRPWPLLALALICLVDLVFPFFGEVSKFFPDRLGIFYLCLLLLAVLFSHSAWAKFLRLRPLVIAGTIAYGVYLLHLPILWIVSYAAFGTGPDALDSTAEVWILVFAFALTMALSLLSWHYFEKPLIRRGYQRKY